MEINDLIGDKMRDLIRALLVPNPEKRPSIWDLEILIDSFTNLTHITLNDDALEIKKRQLEFEKARDKRLGIFTGESSKSVS